MLFLLKKIIVGVKVRIASMQNKNDKKETQNYTFFRANYRFSLSLDLSPSKWMWDCMVGVHPVHPVMYPKVHLSREGFVFQVNFIWLRFSMKKGSFFFVFIDD